MNSDRRNEYDNAFNRKFTAVKLNIKSSKELSDRSFAFSGKIDSVIYLNKFSDKLNLYKVDYSLKKLDTIRIKYPSDFNTKAVNIYKHTLSPENYCSNLYGDILVSYGPSSKLYMNKEFSFNLIQAISPISVIVRKNYTYKGKQNRALSKLSLENEAREIRNYPLPDLPSGIFANDGRLLYDKINKRILYMFYYRGEFLSLDTNLNLIYNSKTIDTVTTARLTSRVSVYKRKNSEKKSTIQTSPPKIVNKYFTVNKKSVYILSLLKADNENKSDFKENQVVDVYDIEKGKYKYSFYIPKFNNLSLNQFQIRNNTLIGIYQNYLVNYSFEE